MSTTKQQEILFKAVQKLSFENYKGLQPNGDETDFINWDIKQYHDKFNQFTASTVFHYNDGDAIKKACLTVEVSNNKMKIINVFPIEDIEPIFY